jgi:galactokinase
MEALLPLIQEEKLQRRFRHVVSENIRTINASKALKDHNIKLLGELLTASHMSLQNDYEVTGKELDMLVHSFLAQEGCVGARMTGAGFGGCSIALFKKGYEKKAIEIVKKLYTDEIGYEPSFYEVNVSGGTREI